MSWGKKCRKSGRSCKPELAIDLRFAVGREHWVILVRASMDACYMPSLGAVREAKHLQRRALFIVASHGVAGPRPSLTSRKPRADFICPLAGLSNSTSSNPTPLALNDD